MDLVTFYQNVEVHPELEGVGVDMSQEHSGVYVKHVPSGLSTRLPSEAIEQADWDLLEDVLTCKREPEVLHTMTRVVGYYSRTNNWNKSKLGELDDRHKGNYAIGSDRDFSKITHA